MNAIERISRHVDDEKPTLSRRKGDRWVGTTEANVVSKLEGGEDGPTLRSSGTAPCYHSRRRSRCRGTARADAEGECRFPGPRRRSVGPQ